MANDSVFTTSEKVALIAAFQRMGAISDSLERIAGALERAYPSPAETREEGLVQVVTPRFLSTSQIEKEKT